MQKNLMRNCLLGILVLAIVPAMALDIEQGDSDKNGGGDPCEADCDDERTDLEVNAPDGIDPDGPCPIPMTRNGGGPILMDLAPMIDCEQGGDPISGYEFTDILDSNGNDTIVGFNVNHPHFDDDFLEACMAENNAAIQWVSLRADRAGLVARIFKFRSGVDPAGGGNIWIGIDDRPEIGISTGTKIQTAEELNEAIVDELVAAGYDVDDETYPNFIIVAHGEVERIWHPPDLDVNQVSLRTTDSGLKEFRIALIADPAAPAVECDSVVSNN